MLFASKPSFRLLVVLITTAIAACLIVRDLAILFNLIRPIPYWDQWEFVKSIPAIKAGNYSITDLFSQHNEHRIATARLFFLIDLFFFDASWYFCTLILYVCLGVIALLIVARLSADSTMKSIVFLVFFGFLSSPCEWENLASGFQIPFPIVNMFAIVSCSSLIIMFDETLQSKRYVFFAAATLSDFLGVFSLASGVLTIIPAIWISLMTRTRSRLFYIYFLLHVLYTFMFLWGYVRSTEIPAVYNLIMLTHYSILYLGASLRGYVDGPILLGTFDVVMFMIGMLSTAYRILYKKEKGNRCQIFTISVSIFIVCGAYLTASGRASLGLETAYGSRYSLQSIIFQLLLFSYYFEELQRSSFSQETIERLTVISLSSILLLSVTSNLALSPLEEWKDRSSVLETVGFNLVNGVYTDNILGLVYPQPDLIKNSLAFFASQKLGPFSPRFGNVFRPPLNLITGVDVASLPGCLAQFSVVRVGPQWLKLEGWVFNPAQPAGNGWIIVMDGSDQDRIVGFGRQAIERYDVDEATQTTVGRSGFNVGLNAPELANASARVFTLVLVPELSSQPDCKVSVSSS